MAVCSWMPGLEFGGKCDECDCCHALLDYLCGKGGCLARWMLGLATKCFSCVFWCHFPSTQTALQSRLQLTITGNRGQYYQRYTLKLQTRSMQSHVYLPLILFRCISDCWIWRTCIRSSYLNQVLLAVSGWSLLVTEGWTRWIFGLSDVLNVSVLVLWLQCYI